MPKSNAQCCKEYRERCRARKPPKKLPKSTVERVREWRAKRRSLNNCPQSDLLPTNATTSSSDCLSAPTCAPEYIAQDTCAVKQESAIDNESVDAPLGHRVKQEFIEIELTPVDAQRSSRATWTPAGAGCANVDQDVYIKGELQDVNQDVCIKDELEDTDLDIEPVVLQHMDLYYKTYQQNTTVTKTENTNPSDGNDATLCQIVKTESVKEKCGAVDGPPCARAASTPVGAGSVKSGIHIAVEGTNLVIAPTVLRHRNNQQKTTVIKTENTNASDGNDPTLCQIVKTENVEDKCRVDGPPCARATSTPVSAGGVNPGVHIAVEGTNLVIAPTVLRHRSNQSMSVVKKENMIASDTHDPVLCSRVKEKGVDDQCVATEPNIYICDYCQKTFPNKSYLKRHITCVHSSRSYKCNLCERSFKCKTYLKAHKAGTHTAFTKERNVYRNVLRSKLKKHMRIVHDVRKVLCKICGAFMMSKYYLHSHMNDIHGQQLVESPFVNRCGYCQKIFSKNNISTHIKNMHADDFHRCSHCNTGFKTMNWLRRHVMLMHPKEDHKGIPAYYGHTKDMHADDLHRCSYCIMGFKTMYWLWRHINLRHPGKEHDEHNQESTYNIDKESGESTHSPVGEVSAAVASASTQQQDVVLVKVETTDKELELGPVVLQHMDCNYRPHKEEPALD